MQSTVKKSGVFITLEGIEGVGKSTCLKFVAKYLQSKDVPIIVTREPGGTPLAEKIRDLLLWQGEKMNSDAELLLLFAARAQHLSEVIFPALAANKWVICDRFTDASYAYQGAGRGIKPERIAVLETWLQGDFRPHLTFLLDAPVGMALSRTRRRGQLDRIESEKEHFFRKVRRCYLQRAKEYSEQYRIIDARKPLSVVKKQLSFTLDRLIQLKYS